MESESPVDKWLLWIGVGMVALSFVRSRRHIPYSFLLGAGLNVLNNWLMVGIDEERNPHAVSDKKQTKISLNIRRKSIVIKLKPACNTIDSH